MSGRPPGGGTGPDTPVHEQQTPETGAGPTAAGPAVAGALASASAGASVGASAGEEYPLDDPWYDAMASGWGALDSTGTPVPPAPRRAPEQDSGTGAAGVYLEVQRSAAFQEVRDRYRRFVVPAALAFLAWYLAYVIAATVAPGLMARPVVGAVNIAMLAGLGQFLTTFLLTWAYARHARLHRDRAALDLRWDTQELTRGMNQ